MFQNQQTASADKKPDPTDRAKDDGQAKQRIRRLPAEKMIVESGNAGRTEVEQKTVKDQVMKPSARLSESRIRIIAAGAAAFHIGETECIFGRAPKRADTDHLRQMTLRLAPETLRPHEQNRQSVERHDQRWYRHRDKRNDAVESSLAQMNSEENIRSFG
jgi:hypothetical protein